MHQTPATGARRPTFLLAAALVVTVAATATVLLALGRHRGLQLSTDQRAMIDRLESVLLHDAVVPQYARVVNEFDQRGYLAGIGDFSTAGGEALEVIQAYTVRGGENELHRTYSTVLATLASTRSDDVGALTGFPQAWQSASGDPTFRRAQHDVLQERSFTPALNRVRDLGINTPLGLAAIYDSLLQHGDDSDPDGLPTLLRKTDAEAGGTVEKVGERTWLKTFLDLRRATLADPAEPAHQEVWPYEVGRVDALATLLADRNDTLVPPLTMAPYGTPQVIDLRPLDLALSPAPPRVPRASPSSSRTGGPGPTEAAPRPSRSHPPTPTGAPASDSPGPSPVRRQGPVIGQGGLCLDVDGGVPAAGNHLKNWTCNGTDAQRWTAEKDGTLRAVTMCAQPRDDSLSPSTPSEIDPCDGRSSQQWRFTGGQLVHPASGLCLGVPGDDPTPGTILQLMTCTGAAGQRWAAPGAA